MNPASAIRAKVQRRPARGAEVMLGVGFLVLLAIVAGIVYAVIRVVSGAITSKPPTAQAPPPPAATASPPPAATTTSTPSSEPGGTVWLQSALGDALDRWVQAGLLTREAAAAIHAHE